MAGKTAFTDASVFNQYTNAGFTLFPLIGHTKKPKEKGFLNLEYDDFFEPEDRNYGVLLKDLFGNKYLVVDVDVRNFKYNDKPLSRLREHLSIPEEAFDTLWVASPSGGYHIYYRLPSEFNEKIVSCLKD